VRKPFIYSSIFHVVIFAMALISWNWFGEPEIIDDNVPVIMVSPDALISPDAIPTPGKNKVHVDLGAADLDAEVERLVGAGATLVGHRGDEAFRWVTLADTQGNEFCVSQNEGS
jgi:hypothetical protein